MKTKAHRLFQYLDAGKEINTEIARKLFGIDHLQAMIEGVKKVIRVKEFYRKLNGKKVRWYVMS